MDWEECLNDQVCGCVAAGEGGLIRLAHLWKYGTHIIWGDINKTHPDSKVLVRESLVESSMASWSPSGSFPCRGQAFEGPGMSEGAQLLEEARVGRGCREAYDSLASALPAWLLRSGWALSEPVPFLREDYLKAIFGEFF